MHAVAAIDVGSNATRLLTAAVASTGVLHESHFERYPMRLGTDVFANGVVSPTRQKALCQVFVEISRELRRRGVRIYRAVATSAMRDARNGPGLVRRIFDESGIVLEIISGMQESRLVRAALSRALGTVDPETLLLDLGGGSLELERAHGRRGRSLPLGSVRLLATYPELNTCLKPAALHLVRQRIEAEVRRLVGVPRAAAMAIGTGGNLDILAKLAPLSHARVPTVNLAELEAFAQKLAVMTHEQKVKTFGVRPDRADLILPALLVINALTGVFSLQTLVVPGTGLREALLFNLMTPTEPGYQARRLLGFGHDAAATADRCAKLAVELFEGLAAAHRLWPPALAPLMTALYCWYFGALLQPNAASQHALYFLQHVDTLDLDSRTRPVAMYAVQTLLPQPADFAGEPQDAQAAQVLGGLLKVVIAMAPQGRRTTALTVDLLQETIQIGADLSAPLTPETVRPLAEALGRPIVVR